MLITVHKFGGGVLNQPASLKQLLKIVNNFNPNIIVVSAFGKTTNALKDLAEGYITGDRNMMDNALHIVYDIHSSMINSFSPSSHKKYVTTWDELMDFISTTKDIIKEKSFCNSIEIMRDSFMVVGEILSSSVVSSYLDKNSFKNYIVMATEFIKTDMNFGSANILRDLSLKYFKNSSVLDFLSNNVPIVTQGFIGATSMSTSMDLFEVSFKGCTTIGREGSDLSAAFIANLAVQSAIDVKEVVLWKDVWGVANQNPRNEIVGKLSYYKKMSYSDLDSAIQKGGFAEGLVHSKVIKELQEFGIPLRIKNFWRPDLPGTLISASS